MIPRHLDYLLSIILRYDDLLLTSSHLIISFLLRFFLLLVLEALGEADLVEAAGFVVDLRVVVPCIDVCLDDLCSLPTILNGLVEVLTGKRRA